MGGHPGGRDRYGYWFPLALLGFLLLGLLGLDSASGVAGFGWFAYAPRSGVHMVSGEQYPVGPVTRYSDLVVFDPEPYPRRDWMWMVVVVAAFVATVGWYGWRARRNEGASIGLFLRLAVGGGLAVAIGYLLAEWTARARNPVDLVVSVGLPLLLLGLVAGLWAYFRLGPGRSWTVVISGASLAVGAGTLLGWQAPGLVEPVLIAAGLLVLARYERSILLTIVAVASFVAMAAFPIGPLGTLIPAMLLLAGAIAALARRNHPAAPTPAPGGDRG